MKYLFDEEEETEVDSRRVPAGRGGRVESEDTEITLGMRSLLGIFFGLVLICGIFFGLGYSVGRGGGHAAAATGTPTSDSAITSDSHADKPSATESAAPPAPVPARNDETNATTVVPESGSTAESGDERPTPAVKPAADTPVTPAASRPSAKAEAATTASTPAAPVTGVFPPSPAGGSRNFMVQIAAVRSQDDAEVLVGALKKHGYSATVRHEPQDQFLHVQVGPFANRTEANGMRVRLMADGYNAMVK